MIYCFHYKFDEENNRYTSLITKYSGNQPQNKVHKYICKKCGLFLHDIDVINLNKKLNIMNIKLNGDTRNDLLKQNDDIVDMLAPVPFVCHEDSKFRDNQYT